MPSLQTIDIDTMPAGREMDARVAEKVMGAICSCDRSPQENFYGDPFYCAIHGIDTMGSVHHYSASIAAAWEVWEKTKEDQDAWPRFCKALIQDWAGDIDLEHLRFPDIYDALKHISPLAICRAAWKAKEHSNEHIQPARTERRTS